MDDKSDGILEYLGVADSDKGISDNAGKVEALQKEISEGWDIHKTRIFFLTSYDINALRSEAVSLCKLLISADTRVNPVFELNSSAFHEFTGDPEVFILWGDRFSGDDRLLSFIQDLEQGAHSKILAGSAVIVALTVEQYGLLRDSEIEEVPNKTGFLKKLKELSVFNQKIRIGFILLSVSFLDMAIWYPLIYQPFFITFSYGYYILDILAILVSIGVTAAGIAFIMIGILHLDLKGKRLVQVMLALFSAVNFGSFLFLVFVTLTGSYSGLLFNSSSRILSLLVSLVSYTLFLAAYSLVPLPFSSFKQKVVLLSATVVAFTSYYIWASSVFAVLSLPGFSFYSITLPFGPMFGAPVGIELAISNSGNTLYFITSSVSNALFFIAYLWVSFNGTRSHSPAGPLSTDSS